MISSAYPFMPLTRLLLEASEKAYTHHQLHRKRMGILQTGQLLLSKPCYSIKSLWAEATKYQTSKALRLLLVDTIRYVCYSSALHSLIALIRFLEKWPMMSVLSSTTTRLDPHTLSCTNLEFRILGQPGLCVTFPTSLDILHSQKPVARRFDICWVQSMGAMVSV